MVRREAARQVRKGVRNAMNSSGDSGPKKRKPKQPKTHQYDELEDIESPLTNPQGRAATLQALRQMDPYEFEHLVADVWEAKGWTTEVSTASNDAGVDVTATRDHPYKQKILIQAKRYGEDTTVGSPEVQQYASLRQHEHDVDAAVIVTTSSFTSSAKDMADRLNVKCVDGQVFLNIIHEAGAVDVLTDYLPRFEALLVGDTGEDDLVDDSSTTAHRDTSIDNSAITHRTLPFNPANKRDLENRHLSYREQIGLASTGTQLVLVGALAHAIPILITDLALLVLVGIVAVPAGVILDARDSSNWQKRGYLYALSGWIIGFGALVGALYVYRRVSNQSGIPSDD